VAHVGTISRILKASTPLGCALQDSFGADFEVAMGSKLLAAYMMNAEFHLGTVEIGSL
jgi:hypothetical protein